MTVDNDPPVPGTLPVDDPSVTPQVTAGGPDAPQAPILSEATSRFQTCRWRRPSENGSPECCSHRDVLPMAGARGFSPDSWCPECGHFKVRRTPKKRTAPEDEPYYYY